jgi:hypothetical protein
MGLIQSMEALEKANRHRTAVARKKREIAALGFEEGRAALAEFLLTCEDPALLSGRVSAYLSAPKHVHSSKVAQTLRFAGVAYPDSRLRELTTHQRETLSAAVLNGYRVRAAA